MNKEDKIKLELHKARRFIGRDKLGEKLLSWSVPADLERYAKRNLDGSFNRFDTIIGFGRFKNNNKLFLAILSGGHLLYFPDNILEDIIKSYNSLKEK